MFNTERIKAISDGLFAILLTILVLDFSIPIYKEGKLGQAVLSQWPSLFAYTMSFFLISVFWLFHHDLFANIKNATPILNMLNLFVLFCITLINYPTSLIAETMKKGNIQDMKTAIIIYDIVAAIISFSYLILYLYISNHPDLEINTNKKPYIFLDPSISISIYLISILLVQYSVLLGAIFLISGILWHGLAYAHLAKSEK